jgi:hypothetical protein
MSLETDLRDLGAHLDHPAGDGIAAAVRAELAATPTSSPTRVPAPAERPAPRPRRRRILLLAAAALLVVLLAVPVAVVALGGRDDGGRPQAHATSPSSARQATSPSSAPAPPPVEVLGLAAARTAVQIPIRVPAGIDVPPRVTVDRRAPGGLVALEYPDFTVVEVAAPAGVSAGEVAGLGPESQVHPVSVRAQPGLWITGTHREIAYLDRDGTLRKGPTRTTGHVLMWVEDGVTYRVEGFHDQIAAMSVADALR